MILASCLNSLAFEVRGAWVDHYVKKGRKKYLIHAAHLTPICHGAHVTCSVDAIVLSWELSPSQIYIQQNWTTTNRGKAITQEAAVVALLEVGWPFVRSFDSDPNWRFSGRLAAPKSQ